MKIRRTQATITALSATGAAALVLGTWCGPAFASADVQTPSPELTSHTDASLQETIDEDDLRLPTIHTIDSSTKLENESKTNDVTILNTELPAIVTRLPGVSPSDLPRFRRHMYRTDI